MTSSVVGADSGADSGNVETTIADNDADQTVMSEAARRRVYSPGIDETAVRLRRVVTIMTLSVGLRL